MEWVTIVFKLAVLVVLDIIAIRFLLRHLFLDYLKAARMRQYGCHVRGVIIEMIGREDMDQQMQYAAVVEYYTHEGVRVVAASRDFKYSRPALNSEVSVCYDKERPLEMLVNPRSVAQLDAAMLFLGWGMFIFLNGLSVWALWVEMYVLFF